jgi:putative drug exporter of the RND superfamily
MLSRLAVFTVRRPKVILIAVLALLGVSIVFGGTVTQKLGVGGFVDPAAESSQVADYLDQNFLTTPNLVLQVIARDGAVENPAVAAAAGRIRQLVEAEPAAKAVGSFSQESAADLRSRDGRSGLILVHVGGTLDEATKTAIRIIDKLPTDDPAVDVRAGGPLGVSVEIEDRVNHDLVISESIALPILLAVLVIVFGGLPAAHHRYHIHRHDTNGVGDHDQHHRCVGARAHCRNGFRSRVIHRFRIADGVTLPRGT